MIEWNKTEEIGATYINMMSKGLREDILSKKEKDDYYIDLCCPEDKKPEKMTDYERGLYSAIGYMRFRVHCMNPL